MTVDQDVEALLGPAPAKTNIVEGIRGEISGYVSEMRRLRYMHNDDAMAWLSSVSARVLELMFATLQNDGRQTTKFRVEELIPLRDELRFQFQVVSRRQSVSQMEWEVARGYEG